MFLKNYYKALVWENHTDGSLNEHSYLVSSTGAERYFKLSGSESYNCDDFLNGGGYYAPYIGRVITANIDKHTIYSPNSNTSTGVIFGDGDTPVTINDYWISGNWISNLSWSNTTNIVYDETGFTVTSLFTLTNNNSESVTIKEIALCAVENYSYSSATATSSDSTYYRFLVERTVLDAPVTIPAGGVGQVTYTVRVNYPTA